MMIFKQMMRKYLFFYAGAVNAKEMGHVVVSSPELMQMTTMTTTTLLTVWPEDERDRKRAPARC